MFKEDFSASIWNKLKLFSKPISEIYPLEIIPANKNIFNKCSKVLRTFFTKGVGKRSPLKGFLFEGVPGTGKTELVKQIARSLISYQKEDINEFFFLFVDGATIATPRWGDAESTLKAVFSFHHYLRELKPSNRSYNPRLITLFDDIESLMLSRSASISKEWHYSINSVLFHAMDNIDASQNFIFATTNKPELVDDALRDRLYPIEFELPDKNSLLFIAEEIVRNAGEIGKNVKDDILLEITEKIDLGSIISIRDIEREIMVLLIERGAW